SSELYLPWLVGSCLTSNSLTAGGTRVISSWERGSTINVDCQKPKCDCAVGGRRRPCDGRRRPGKPCCAADGIASRCSGRDREPAGRFGEGGAFLLVGDCAKRLARDADRRRP